MEKGVVACSNREDGVPGVVCVSPVSEEFEVSVCRAI